jgi:uncharacterized FlgJ-related protein
MYINRYKRAYPEYWEAAKMICKAKHEAMTFNSVKELKNYVKQNKQYIPEVVTSGVFMGYSIKL